jgi:predicted transglutaminase-like cysteine proteinase
MPSIAVPEAERPPQPNVFGTVALPVRARQATTRWTKLMRASLNQPALIRLVAPARGLSPQQQASFVQAAVNRSVRSGWSYDCSDDGYWAAGGETLNRGKGDCMDILIAKMEALRSLGFADKDLYLTTGYYHAGRQSGRGQGAAALLVRIGEGFWLLPEQSSRLIDAAGGDYATAEFTPYITYGCGGTWVHGRPMKSIEAAEKLAVRGTGQTIVSLAR